MPDLVKLSKFLSLMLRHQADQFGLDLDAQGFTPFEDVVKQVRQRYGETYQAVDVLKVIDGDTTGKKRFELVNGRIRAMYGHSAVREISYETVEPPELLYHGTTDNVLDAIRRDGLQRRSRQYVHMAIHQDRAEQVATRHGGKPIILTIRAADAHKAGVKFYQPEPEHFLADEIPAAYIDFPK